MKSFINWSIALAVVFTFANDISAQTDQPASDKPVSVQTAAETTATTDKPALPALTCSCCTQGGAAQTSPIILALDIDKDGEVSAAEIKNAVESLSALDLNRDGKLSRVEMHERSGFSGINMPAVSNRQLGVTRDFYAKKLLQQDTNGNGQLEKDEMNGPTLEILDLIDRNGDECLSYAELKNMTDQIKNISGERKTDRQRKNR